MGKKKSRQTTTATYGWQPHQGTKDEDAYRNSIQAVDFSTPIHQVFGQAENDINDTVFEDSLSPGAAEKIKYGRMFDLTQRKGAALAGAKGQEHAWKAGQLGNLAGMTQNKFVQTGGTAMGTQSGASTGELLGFGASMAGA